MDDTPDRFGTRDERPAAGRPEAPMLSSRRDAIERCQTALDRAEGPVLLVGEPGMGKTWLVDRLIAADESRHWLRVDLSPSVTPRKLVERLAHGLGLATSGDATAELAEALEEEHDAGRSWGLAIDEAQPGLGCHARGSSRAGQSTGPAQGWLRRTVAGCAAGSGRRRLREPGRVEGSTPAWAPAWG